MLYTFLWRLVWLLHLPRFGLRHMLLFFQLCAGFLRTLVKFSDGLCIMDSLLLLHEVLLKLCHDLLISFQLSFCLGFSGFNRVTLLFICLLQLLDLPLPIHQCVVLGTYLVCELLDLPLPIHQCVVLGTYLVCELLDLPLPIHQCVVLGTYLVCELMDLPLSGC